MEIFRNGFIRYAVCAALAAGLMAGAVQVVVSPPSKNLAIGGVLQFSAAVTSATNTAVAWSVNGIAGGNSTVGAIDNTGLYQSPSAFPSPNTVTIQATSAADPTATGTASLTLQNPSPILAKVSPSAFPVGSFSITLTGQAFLPAAKVIFGSGIIATQYVSSTQLTATGTASQAGTVAVLVSNGDPGPAVSQTFNVQVDSAPPGAITVVVN